MYDVISYPLRDLTSCSATLRKIGAASSTLEDAAQGIVSHMYEALQDGQNQRICALVRFFVTRPFARLSEDQQACVHQILGDAPATAAMRCLVLIGTAGMRPEWNDPHASVRHRAIPLASTAMVERMPMIGQLVKQFGLEVRNILEPDPRLLVDLEQRSYNVFHVAEARGSPHVPAQDSFVIPYGIRSVVGFGGLLPSGALFAVVLFTTVPLPRETADLFRPLALSVKLAILPFMDEQSAGE